MLRIKSLAKYLQTGLALVLLAASALLPAPQARAASHATIKVGVFDVTGGTPLPLVGVMVKIKAIASGSCATDTGFTGNDGIATFVGCSADGSQKYVVTQASLPNYREGNSPNKINSGRFNVSPGSITLTRVYLVGHGGTVGSGSGDGVDAFAASCGGGSTGGASACGSTCSSLVVGCSGPTTFDSACGTSAKCLAQEMLKNKNISYWTNNGANTRTVVQDLANGKQAATTCANASTKHTNMNPQVLEFILDYAQKRPVMVNALTDKCHSSGSNHYVGKAVDFECQAVNFNTAAADKIAKKFRGGRNFETCSSQVHWHYEFLH